MLYPQENKRPHFRERVSAAGDGPATFNANRKSNPQSPAWQSRPTSAQPFPRPSSWRLIAFSSLDLVSYDREISLADTQDFLRCKPRITPVTLSIFPGEHEPSLTNTTA